MVSDVVCPWCYIGKKNWEEAAQSWISKKEAEGKSIRFSREWKPFRLDPSLPMEGKPRDEVLSMKFGGSRNMQAAFHRVVEAGKKAGIEMVFEPGLIQPNTLHLHRLIQFAAGFQLSDSVAEALFASYFTKNEDLTNRETITRLGIEAGISQEEMNRFWEEEIGLPELLSEEEQVRQMGVTGVPFFILNDKYAFSGAQPPEVIESILDQIWEEDKKLAQENQEIAGSP